MKTSSPIIMAYHIKTLNFLFSVTPVTWDKDTTLAVEYSAGI